MEINSRPEHRKPFYLHHVCIHTDASIACQIANNAFATAHKLLYHTFKVRRQCVWCVWMPVINTGSILEMRSLQHARYACSKGIVLCCNLCSCQSRQMIISHHEATCHCQLHKKLCCSIGVYYESPDDTKLIHVKRTQETNVSAC